MNIHPKLAGGIFTLLYGIIGLLFLGIFKINLFECIWFYIIGLIIGFGVYKIFADRYDGIE